MRKASSFETHEIDSQVSQAEIDAAMAAVEEMDIPEAEKSFGDDQPVNEKEMKDAVEARGSPELEPDIESRIATLRRELEEASSPGFVPQVDRGGDGIGPDLEIGYGKEDPPELKPYYWHNTKYERPHGDHDTIAKKAFGHGFWGLLNLFNPKAWRAYWKMLKEHDDPDLLKMTKWSELGGYYKPNRISGEDVQDKE